MKYPHFHWLFSATLLFLCLGTELFGASNPTYLDHKISQTALKESVALLSPLDERSLENLGFSSHIPLSELSAGTPVPVYAIEHDSLVFINIWRVPLLVDGAFTALATVIPDGDHYRVVELGASMLARILDQPSSRQASGLLRVYDLSRDYLMMADKDNQLMFYPVRNTGEQPVSFDELLNKVRAESIKLFEY